MEGAGPGVATIMAPGAPLAPDCGCVCCCAAEVGSGEADFVFAETG